MNELSAKTNSQPNSQSSVLAVVCTFVIGRHEGLQDELTEIFIETTTKRPNDWLQALELALRGVEPRVVGPVCREFRGFSALGKI
jgi:hypothetical protein